MRRLRKRGLCMLCGTAINGYGVRCAPCAKAHADQARLLRKQRKKYGLCTTCGEPVLAGYSMCERHLDYFAAKARERKS
jgi:tetrahydromethanopterin S-methyltransferase subunit D